MLSTAARYDAAARGPRNATSPTLRIAVSGVRSSWDTLAVNRRIRVNEESSRPSISLNTAARRPSSSSGLSRGSRSPSRDAVMARARPVMSATGASALRAR